MKRRNWKVALAVREVLGARRQLNHDELAAMRFMWEMMGNL